MFEWCIKKEQMVASELCIVCTTRRCPKKPQPTRIVLKKIEKKGNMYIGKTTENTFKEISIVDFKNPTNEELHGIVEVYSIKDAYTPVIKIVLEPTKRKLNKEEDTANDTGTDSEQPVQHKRKSSKRNKGEV